MENITKETLLVTRNPDDFFWTIYRRLKVFTVDGQAFTAIAETRLSGNRKTSTGVRHKEIIENGRYAHSVITGPVETASLYERVDSPNLAELLQVEYYAGNSYEFDAEHLGEHKFLIKEKFPEGENGILGTFVTRHENGKWSIVDYKDAKVKYFRRINQ